MRFGSITNTVALVSVLIAGTALAEDQATEYHDKNKEFTVSAGPVWTRDEASEDKIKSVVLALKYSSDDKHAVRPRFNCLAMAKSSATLAAIADAMVAKAKATCPDQGDLPAPKAIQLDGVDGMDVSYKLIKSGMTIRFHTVIVFHEQRLLTCQFMCDDSASDKLLSVGDEVFKSFNWSAK